MKKHIVFCLAFLWFGCSEELVDPLPLDQTDEISEDVVIMGFQLNGDEWEKARESQLQNRQKEQPLYYGYDVFELHDGGSIYHASGATNDITEVEIPFQKRLEYLVVVSSVQFDEKFDMSKAFLFNMRRIGPVSDWPIYRLHDPSQIRNRPEIRPFTTSVESASYQQVNIDHDRFESDKFIGYTKLYIEEDKPFLEIDMYRLSAGLAFQAINLQDGELEIIVNPSTQSEFSETRSVKYVLTHDEDYIKDLRPYTSLSRFDERYVDDIKADPDNNTQEYNVEIYYKSHNQNGTGDTSRKLTSSTISLKRNHLMTYEIDMSDFDLDEGENEEESGPRLNFVDEELIEGETIRIGK
ncbi:hypothetical protein [Litoribacter populi]|uniref:hypothetical protein n=1 Tax=Litoribacter populi TaxID=2598460 RepID=UPI00117F94F3|nr:hypothetical protein [Litoribacter populi]